MYQTITKSDFRNAFVTMDRQNQFSYEGLGVLYDYLDEIGYGNLDVIELCCDFTEYKSVKDFQEDYGEEYETLDDIKRMTIVLPIDSERFIIQAF